MISSPRQSLPAQEEQSVIMTAHIFSLTERGLLILPPKAILDKIDIHSLQGFTRYIKDYILQSYQEICTVVNCYICGVPV